MAEFRPSFSDLAAEFILSLPKRRQRVVMDRAYELARHPFLESDYRLVDVDGRPVDQLLLDGFPLAGSIRKPDPVRRSFTAP